MFIPIFPLQLVVFPGEYLNLHIFEPRYKQLIQDCQDQNLEFGIPPYFNDRMHSIGTLVEIDAVHKVYEDGRLDISVIGKSIFEIQEIHKHFEEKLYSGAEIMDYPVFLSDSGIYQPELLKLLSQLFDILQINKELPDLGKVVSYNIAHLSGLIVEQEYELLKIKEEMERQQFIIEHLKRIMPSAVKMKQIKIKAQMNGDFREFGPLDF